MLIGCPLAGGGLAVFSPADQVMFPIRWVLRVESWEEGFKGLSFGLHVDAQEAIDQEYSQAVGLDLVVRWDAVGPQVLDDHLQTNFAFEWCLCPG